MIYPTPLFIFTNFETILHEPIDKILENMKMYRPSVNCSGTNSNESVLSGQNENDY